MQLLYIYWLLQGLTAFIILCGFVTILQPYIWAIYVSTCIWLGIDSVNHDYSVDCLALQDNYFLGALNDLDLKLVIAIVCVFMATMAGIFVIYMCVLVMCGVWVLTTKTIYPSFTIN